MSVIQVLAGEINVPTTTGTATSFSEARRVRLVNTSAADRIIYVLETAGGSGIGSFTMAPFVAEGGDGDVIIEKEYTQVVYASGDKVKGVKVGFVG
tara:strand:- start:551 stop:838 length:288 start_codon:yes stop_codon:yes gene_type:complete